MPRKPKPRKPTIFSDEELIGMLTERLLRYVGAVKLLRKQSLLLHEKNHSLPEFRSDPILANEISACEFCIAAERGKRSEKTKEQSQ